MGRFSGKTCRLATMLSLTFSFFLVELIFGYITHSLALIGDSYHMLSDVVALIVGIASVRISKLHSQKNTYGWARAEVLGALVNAVFLIALCFTIFVEAIERLTSDNEIHREDWMLYVGIAGLVVNILGLILFHRHSHGHSHGGGGGESHSHKDKHTHNESHNHKIGKTCSDHDHTAVDANPEKISLHSNKGTESMALATDNTKASDVGDDVSETDDVDIDSIHGNRKIHSSSQLNMRGVFLHVLGDALGSVVVIVSALIIKFVDGDWKYKVDPAMSMVMVIIILSTSIPLLKESALILLQTVPTHIQVAALKHKLVTKVSGVLAVHEFHVWQLAGNRIIASAHIRCHNLQDYMRIAEEVKSFFHDEGIHSTTIQPEFVENISSDKVLCSNSCLLDCICRGEVKCCQNVLQKEALKIFPPNLPAPSQCLNVNDTSDRLPNGNMPACVTNSSTNFAEDEHSLKQRCTIIPQLDAAAADTMVISELETLPTDETEIRVITKSLSTIEPSDNTHSEYFLPSRSQYHSSSPVSVDSSQKCHMSSLEKSSTSMTAALDEVDERDDPPESDDVQQDNDVVRINMSKELESDAHKIPLWQPSNDTLKRLRNTDKSLELAIKRLSRDLDEIRGNEGDDISLLGTNQDQEKISIIDTSN